MNWDVAAPKQKKHKLFFWRPEGCFKTRTALRIGNITDEAEWQKLLVPFDVNSAREMTVDQLNSFINNLKALRTTGVPEA